MPASRSPRVRPGRALLTGGAVALMVAAFAAAPAWAGSGRPVTGPVRAAPLASVPRPAAAPQGPLTSTACTTTGTTSSCELWAKAGSVTLPGAAAAVPIWGFAGAAADPAATPGPVLVVPAGSSVTVTLHNTLAQPVALAFPGVTGMPTDMTGAAGGAATSYTFVAARPGSYLYEAGHTADGARQAAMGLVGAMVVRPADPSTDYGTADSAFQDEAVLVLSEVDPALNADPLNFDLRKYNPSYRLVNGKAYPETQRIATDISRRVLLRYVNAGQLSHSMSLLGVDQTLLGQDARPRAFTYPVAAEAIPPGATLDTLVSVPGGPDGNAYPLYEAAGQLNNAGQRYGTPVAGQTLQQAFGGMLTFLDTNAVPPTTDVAGPVTSHVTAAPATVTALGSVTVTADLSDVRNGNSAVVRAEYVLDSLSVAEGTGTPFTGGTFGTPTVTGATAQVASSTLRGLPPGRHTVYVRAQDAAGNWGPVGSAVFTMNASGPVTSGLAVSPAPTNGTADLALSGTGDDSALAGTVTAAEYFLDAAGAEGTGSALALSPAGGAAIVAETATIPAVTVSALAEGHHTVYVRSKDSYGLWGVPATFDLVVDRTAPTLLSGAVQPNPVDGTTGSPADPTAIEVDAAFQDTTAGGAVSAVAAAEGFLDTAGTTGTGFVFVARDGGFNSAAESTYGLIPLTELTALADGIHHVLVHSRDSAGNWGPLTSVDFTVQRTNPNAIFANGFETGLAPWSGRAGTVAATATAALTGTTGLAASGATGYVIDTHPTAEHAYHATFQFNRNTLVASGGVAILTARTGANQTAFAVQYRTSGANRQVRLGVLRSGNTTAYSAWSTLPAGTVTIGVDWTSATAGSGVLKVNGTVVATVTGNTSPYKVETVWLGQAGGTGITGTAYYDTFTSTR
jgi:hypothetical protein